MVAILVFDRWQVVQRRMQPVPVEPVDPVHGGQLEMVDAAPGPFGADQLGLVEPDQRLGLGIVIGVADSADGGDRPGVQQPIRVPN